jgi:hypothetical protein
MLQKKHLENFQRHRISRRNAREYYVRVLEVKAHNFERLYADTQQDIKILREKLALLEGRIAKAQRNHNVSVVSRVNQLDEQNNNDDSSSNVVINNGTFHIFKIYHLYNTLLNNTFTSSHQIGLLASVLSNNHGENNNVTA